MIFNEWFGYFDLSPMRYNIDCSQLMSQFDCCQLQLRASLVAQLYRICLPLQETWVWSLGQGRSSGEGNGNILQYSCLKNPTTEEPGGLQSMGSQRVRQNWTTNTFTFTFTLGQSNLQSSCNKMPVTPILPFFWSIFKKVMYKSTFKTVKIYTNRRSCY